MGYGFKAYGYEFEHIFSSELTRSKQTAEIILENMLNQEEKTGLKCTQPEIKIHSSWRLNDRHFGEIQAMTKQDAILEHGWHNVEKWVHGLSEIPPSICIIKDEHP